MAADRRTFLKDCLVSTGAAVLGSAPGAMASAVASNEQYDHNAAMLNDCTLCVGCRACQNVCRDYNELPASTADPLHDMPLGLDSQHYTVIKMMRRGSKESFVKRQCMHCNRPSCVSACPVGALKKEWRGHVSYDADKCIGCRYCMVACPFNVPRFDYDSATPEIHKCTFCDDRITKGFGTKCAEVCPTGAIKFGSRRDLIEEARERIAKDPQRYVNHVYGEQEAGGTSVMYLAGVPFSTLGLPKLGSDALPETAEKVQHGIFKWFVTPIALFGLLGLARVANLTCDPETDEDCIEED